MSTRSISGTLEQLKHWYKGINDQLQPIETYGVP